MQEPRFENSAEAPDVNGAGCQTCGKFDNGLPECDDCFDVRWGMPVLPIAQLASVTLDVADVPLEAAL
jgi:hypothetical protein